MPRNPPTSEEHRRGRHIEERLLRILCDARTRRGLDFSQPDALVSLADGTVFLVEVKAQDMFTPPPFYGHGLPVPQAERYMRIRELTGLRTLLMVWDEQPGRCQGWLDELENGRYHDTNGARRASPRRIYDIESFRRVDEAQPAPTVTPNGVVLPVPETPHDKALHRRLADEIFPPGSANP